MGVYKKKIMIYLFSIVVCSACILNWFSSSLMPVVVSYGDYECQNTIVSITNNVIEQLNHMIKDESIIEFNEEESSLNYNVEILNSITITAISKLQYYLNKLEKGECDDFLRKDKSNDEMLFLRNGIVYSIPVSKIFNNSVISSLFGNILVRYKMIGQISGEIISEISEYGINNALIEIKLKIKAKVQTIAPTMTDQKKIEINVPLSMRLLQGKIPNIFYGSQVIGGVYE